MRRTKATPDDDLAFIAAKLPDEIPADEIHISVAFTWDIPAAEQLAEQYYRQGYDVLVGGPAYNAPGGDFVPGMYLRQGYVITSRGCPNRCWFCSVPNREGGMIRQLPITEGYNVLDDNLLACSDDHINAVFDMLARQQHRPIFSGGLEAKMLKPWHARRLKEIKTERMYFAYDTPDDRDPLFEAGKLLIDAGFTVASHRLMCYVLIGYPGDTVEDAEARMVDTIKAGFMPYAMLYRDDAGARDEDWRTYQRTRLRPQIVGTWMRDIRRRMIL